MISNDLLKEKIIDTIIQDIKSPIKKISEITSVVSKGTTPRGGNVCYTENGVLFIRAENVGYGSNNLLNKKFVDIETHENYLKRSILKENDILVSIAGALGRTSYIESEMLPCNCNQAVAFIRIKENIDFVPQYICYCIMSKKVQISLLSQVKKTAQPNLTLEHIKNIKIPFPTYEEQLEITKRINGIFELIDRKEKNDQEKERLKDLLKTKILDSAIHGTLVENDLSLSPADVRGVDNVPFEIPSNWKWAKLKDVVTINPRNKISDELGVSFLPMTNIDGGYNNSYKAEIKPWNEVKSGYTHFANNDVIIAKITPCFENRKSAYLNNLTNGYGAGTTELHVLRDDNDIMYMPYLLWYSKTSYFINGGKGNFTGTAGQQRISKKWLEDFFVSIPPLEEQRRIVEKIEQCFELIEQL